MNPSRMEVRDWLFRGLGFESDAEQYRLAGLRVGADASVSERALIDESLEPFGVTLRNNGLRMARLYALLFCFENSVRTLIAERLIEHVGTTWWSKAVPKKIRELAESRKTTAMNDSWLEGDKAELLSFLEFGDLASIIVDNWKHFEDIIPSQHWLKQRMDELEKVRNFIAHNRTLQSNEHQRVEMYVRDWNRSVGL